MAEGVRVQLDIDAEIAEVMLEGAALAEFGAQAMAEELAASIEISDEPAPPGSPPHSRGPLKESFKSSSAKRSRDGVTAWAYSMSTTEGGDESLAEVLDEGRGPVHPHPFLHASVDRARARLDAEVARANQRLRSGG